MNWKKMATDGAVGLAAGGLDAFVQEKTDTQVIDFTALPANAGKTLSQFSRYSTYYNYGLPLVLTAAVAAGYPRSNDMQTRMMVVAGQLVGRRGTAQLIDAQKKPADRSFSWHRAGYGGEAAAAAAEAARAAQAAAGRAGTVMSGSRGSL